jgi:hypothetical protein
MELWCQFFAPKKNDRNPKLQVAGTPLHAEFLYARILRIEFYGTIEMVLTSVALVRSARLA